MAAEPTRLDLGAPRRIHVVGIGGAGMSAIAVVLARMGHTVSGSDLKDSRALARLRAAGIDARVGHEAVNVEPGLDAVVVSTAIPPTNPEIVEAQRLGIPVHRRAEALRALVATRRGIAVAGSHGKTTTSSMLALVLRGAGWRPTFLIGGDVNEVGTNAAYDDGEWLVVEADESDGTFLELPAEAAIVTNVEADHLDHYGSFAALVDAFVHFLEAVPGPRVVCADEPHAAAIAARVGARTYGFAPTADYRIVRCTGGRHGSEVELTRDGVALGSFSLPVPGEHNATNAVAAAALATELGVPFADTARALAGFGGVARRFEFRGELDGVTLVDDYAHLPSEVQAALRTARAGGWDRVIAVFQPHRYSRTASLWRDFADAFTDADLLVLTDVYGAGEQPRPGISGRLLVRAVLDAHPAASVVYLPYRSDVVDVVPRLTRPGDVVLTLGAGDLTTVPDVWLGADAEAVPGVSPDPTTAATLDAAATALAAAVPGSVTRDVPASDLGTYRLGGPIAVLVRVASDADLARVSEVLAEHRVPVLVVGRGSNLLVADAGFAGVGLVLEGDFERVVIDADRTRVRAGGAVPLPVLARRCAAAGAGGLEFYVGIPGSVGGAVRMNAGGHGCETRDVLVAARVRDVHRPGAGITTHSVDDLELGYRTSTIGPSDVVVDAELAVRPDDPAECDARIDEVVRWRREHQPGGANGGSVFRNPPDDSAGRLIDVSGCKGLRVGGAVVSEKHANFFQAEPDATADDVARLVALVRERVQAATGVTLQPELVMVGFEPAASEERT